MPEVCLGGHGLHVKGEGRWRLLAWAGTLGVILLCLLPARAVPETGGVGLDKLLHLLAFLAVGYSWRRSGSTVGQVLLIGLVLALGTEIAQALLPGGRSGDWRDALADLLGVLLALVVHARVHRAS